jgi:hypothetical protein
MIVTIFLIIRIDYENGYLAGRRREAIVLNHRRVSKYTLMSEQMVVEQSGRNKVLSLYESFFRSRLEKFWDTPAAQSQDWLKEHFKDLPKVSKKTVFNFVPLKSFAAKGLESGLLRRRLAIPLCNVCSTFL